MAAIAEEGTPQVFFEDLLDGEEIIFSPGSDDPVSLDAPNADEDASSATSALPTAATDVNPFDETGVYEIYPTPQSVVYGAASSTVSFNTSLPAVFEDGIDSYTVDRAEEAFGEIGVTLAPTESALGKVLRVGVKGSGGVVDAYFNSHAPATTGLYNKYDAYQLIIDANGVSILGKDTDAAFYALTTVKRIFQQVTNRTVRTLTVEDYADVPLRGFIEGYYGNPWTVEDRAALMEFGGELKMNIYFYAPKDDPKHSTKWRELYTDEELETLIRPLAEAGNKSKCYYGFALHPFWENGINYADDAAYASDLAVLKAKYEQAMSVGVRQIAVLADDRGVPGVGVQNSYVRLLNDLTEWVSSDEMQAKYPGLKTTIPFCPNDYMSNASSAQMQALKALPDSVALIQTGGAIWGSVSHSYLNTYRTNMGGRGVFMWVNWPCSDKSKGSLIMGAHDTVLQNNLTQEDIDVLQGIMLNPMQQSEPSKAAIFTNADYAWNVWNGSDSAQRIADAWNDAFKYIDHDNAIETAESAALRELAKHMIHNNGAEGWRGDWHETMDLQQPLNDFLAKMEAGTLTDADIAEMRAEFVTLHDAAVLYKGKTSGNLRILGKRNADGSYPNAQEQMAPWLDFWVEYTQATLDLLDALKLMQHNADGSKDTEIVAKYLSGQGSFTAANSHSFYYVDHYENALAGGERLVPFTEAVLDKVALAAKLIIAPTAVIETIITSRTDTPTGGLDAMRDGSTSTGAVFKTPTSISVGTYVGVQYNHPFTLKQVRFVTGASNENDTFNDSKLQYLDESGTWRDIPGATFAHADLTMDATGLNVKALGVRVIATSERTNTWLGIKEIFINDEFTPAQEGGAEVYTGTVSLSSDIVVRGGALANAANGDTSNDAQLSRPSDHAQKDQFPANAWIQLDLGEAKYVGHISILQDNRASGGDRMNNAVLEYSTDGTNFTSIATGLNANSIEQDTDITARYIRLKNGNADTNGWVRIANFAATGAVPEPPPRNDIEKIAYQSDAVKRINNPVGILNDDSASLSSDNVMLRPGEFVGVALPRIRAVKEIVADYTPAPGLVLMVGMSEADMQPVSSYAAAAASAGQASLLANDDAVIPYSGYARYVRLENTGTQTVSTRITQLSVSSEEVSGISFLETNIGTSNTYYNADDARPNEATGNWFDGDFSTTATYATPHNEGEYVTYDLGQTREITRIDAVVQDSAKNFVRFGEIQVSPDGQDWTTVVEIATTNTEANGGFNDTPLEAGWASPYPGMPNTAYQTGTIAPTQARYLRLYITKTLSGGRFPALAEVVINNNEYVPAVNDPTFEADPIEQGASCTPAMTRDGDLTTGFRPNMTDRTSGSLIYRLSDQTAIGQINIVQDTATPSNATVRIRTLDGWQTLPGTLTEGFTQLPVPEDVTDVLEIELSWGDATPTFYEIIPVPRDNAASGGGQASSAVETVPINSYSGGDRKISFDENWKFNLGDADGASALVYNDSSWTTLDLPHDFSIDQDYTSAGEAESAYLPGGTGWYRKSFSIDPTWANKVLSIDFGGAYMETDVYLNGTKLGSNYNGYNPFSFVLPGDLLNYSGENVIAVKVVNAVPSSRWYSGSGIYRSVNLTVTDPVHVARYGTNVVTTNAGAVTVKTTVQNDGSAAASVTLKQEIFELDSATYEKKGSAVASVTGSASSVAAGGSGEVTQNLSVTSPKLWSSWDKGEPNLYVLVTTVQVGGQAVDTYETEFGFREIEFTTDVGFKLNGEPVKLKGVCQHHDQGGLGAEAWYRALERQVEILMDMGVNSIRNTHNPADDALIEICNRKGVLIIDEAFDCWDRSKNGNSNDFARYFNVAIAEDNHVVGGEGRVWSQFVLETMVKRDMNAPCVIMYSLGNEILGTSPHAGYVTIANNLVSWKEAIDTTRPVTMGDDTRTNSTGTSVAQQVNAIIAEHGVIGFNYCYTRGDGVRDVMPAAHNLGWLLYGSETASHINSRGVYNTKANGGGNSDKLLTSYDKSRVGWGDTVAGAWWYTIRFDYNMGEYVWTGFDYLGEPTPYNGTSSGAVGSWPSPKSSYFGAIDTNGLPKDSFWLYRALWNETDTTLHLLPTWDREDLVVSNGNVEVVSYTNAPVIRLYLNGTEIGAAKAVVNRSNDGNGIYTYRTYEAAALKNGGTNTFSPGSTSHTGDFTGTALYATFNVPYAAGTLEVKAFESESATTPMTGTVGRSVVKTTTGASKLVAYADRNTIQNDGRDLSYITIDITDASGEIVNGATNDITVSVEGDGVFMALDNGVQPDHTPYASATRAAGAGRLVAIVQSTKTSGEFTLTATSPGLSSASVTVRTSGVDSSATQNVPVSYDIAKTIYVQLNTEPTLPETVAVNLGNGTSTQCAVTWDRSYDKSLLATAGSEFSISGSATVNGFTVPVSVGVVVLDDIAALLNYSTAIQVGEALTLPATRPAVMADGTVVTAQFPVTWDVEDGVSYKAERTVVINGTAEAFGKTYNVTATVRVVKPTYMEEGEAVVGTTVLENGVSIGLLADLHPAYADGNASTAKAVQGAIGYSYDTAQNIYKIELTYKGTPPTGGVSLAWSGTGYENTELANSWNPIRVSGVVSGSTVTYQLPQTYSAESLKFTFTNQVQLAEIRITKGLSVFSVGSTALLDNVNINGLPAVDTTTEGTVLPKTIRTSSATGVITAVSGENVAVTILPENADSQVIIVTESEDHAARDKYVVQLDAALDASDSSNDYPYNKTTVYAPSAENNNSGDGPDDFAIDNNESTYWHSHWSGSGVGSTNLTDKPEERYIQLTLEEATELSALRYKPRPTIANGIVVKYRVEVSTDGTNFTPVASGDWERTTAWKLAEFDQPTVAKYVRLYGVETRGSDSDTSHNKYMSCAELRVVASNSKIDLSAASVTVSPESFTWTNVELRPGDDPDLDATVTVTLYGETLRQGVDYELSYENNVDPGTAYVYAQAKNTRKYTGAAAGTFQIVKEKVTVTSFQPYTLAIYPGETPTLPESVWANMSDQTRVLLPVIWDEVPESFYMDPADDVADITIQGELVDEELLGENSGTPSLTLHLARSQSVNGISMVTPAGVQPVLPDVVTVQFDDGTSEERSVTWDLSSVSFDTAGQTVQVIGDVHGILIDAVASVRVAASTASDTDFARSENTGSYNADENLSFATTDIFPFAMAWHSSGDNNPYTLIDGNFNSSNSKDRWCDWERNTIHDSIWAGVAFESTTPVTERSAATTVSLKTKTVNQVKLRFIDENNRTDANNLSAVTFPAEYKIQYYTGPLTDLTFNTTLTHGDNSTPSNGRVRYWSNSPLNDDSNWAEVTYSGTKPAIVLDSTRVLEIPFEAVNTAIIRVWATARSGDHWVGMGSLEVYGLDAPTANRNFTVSSVTLDGVEKKNEFYTENGVKVLEVTLARDAAIPQLAVTATDNASVAITQASRVPGAREPGSAWAQAVVTSEAGNKTETYLVKFTREGATSGYFIEIDPTVQADSHVTISPEGGEPGTEITVSVARGYELTDLWISILDGSRAGQLITPKDGKFLMPDGNVSFSANVTPKTYNIVYVLNGGADGGQNRKSFTVNTSSFTLRAPTRAGYTFTGWLGTGLEAQTMNVTIAKGTRFQDLTFIATWQENAAIGGGGGNNSGGSSGGGISGITVPSPSEDMTVTATDPATGNTTVTTATPTGLVTIVTTTPTGAQTAVIQLPQSSGASMEAVMPTLDAAKQPYVVIQNGAARPVSLTIPVQAEDGVVAVRIETDGSETVIPMSVLDDSGLRLKTQPGEQTIRLIDNSKTFVDVPADHWAAKNVGFVASHEIFNGVGDNAFAPAMPMTRAMMTTVLWRMAEQPTAAFDTLFADVEKGSYYEEAAAWGVATGVVKGTDTGFEPDTSVSRETLAVLLYRAAGSPAVVDQMPSRFTDGAQVADWAQAGVIWCIQNDIIRGRDDGAIDPKATASRAEVAAMLQRFVEQQV